MDARLRQKTALSSGAATALFVKPLATPVTLSHSGKVAKGKVRTDSNRQVLRTQHLLAVPLLNTKRQAPLCLVRKRSSACSSTPPRSHCARKRVSSRSKAGEQEGKDVQGGPQLPAALAELEAKFSRVNTVWGFISGQMVETTWDRLLQGLQGMAAPSAQPVTLQVCLCSPSVTPNRTPKCRAWTELVSSVCFFEQQEHPGLGVLAAQCRALHSEASTTRLPLLLSLLPMHSLYRVSLCPFNGCAGHQGNGNHRPRCGQAH